MVNPPPNQGYGNPYAPQPGPYAPPVRTLSLVSLVLGIIGVITFGFFILPQLGAIITGHLALAREPEGRGMAIAGLAMGYTVLVLFVLLMVLIFAVFGVFAYSLLPFVSETGIPTPR